MRCINGLIIKGPPLFQGFPTIFLMPLWNIPYHPLYGIFPYIYHKKSTLHVGKYTSPMDAMGMNMFFEGLEDFPMSSPSSGPHTQVLNVMTGAWEPNCWVLTHPTRREGRGGDTRNQSFLFKGW